MSQIIDQQVSTANPFPGLRPFKIEESHLFFGREGQSDEVLLKLSKSRFVAVIGPSGSGKSSFIYCGVMPILYGGFLTDASPDWEVIVTRPGAGPIDNLAESLLKNNAEYQAADVEEKKIKRTIFSTLLKSSSLGLVEAIEQGRRKKDVNYLVLVDQFEELFRFKDSSDANSVNETLAFVNLLIEAVNYPDAPIYVAITMRSDFIGDCAQFPDLTRKINDSHYLIPQLTRDQKRRAIEGPVAVGGAKITPRLTQQLLNDLGDNPDQLPILQHALMRTWSYWTRYKDYDEEPVDLKHYEAIGTMAEALSMHANEAFDELTEEQKRIAEILFKAITEKRGENFGIRRPTKIQEIAAIADVSENDVADVIEKFREPGRSLLTPAFGTPLVGKAIVDISHESLMRIWVRLKNWVDDEADAVQMYTRLAEAASMYQVGKAGLWRPPDLQLALNWQVKHKPTLVWGQRYHPAFERTMIFLEYSKKEWETEQRIKELEQKRKLQRARIVALVLATATIVSLIFLVFAFVQKAAADTAREQAVANEKEAQSQRAKAEENAREAQRQSNIANIQRQKADSAKTQAILSAEEAIRQGEIAKAERDRAEENEDKALAQEKIAREQKDLAVKAQTLAETKEAEARRARYIAQAKQMAVKSKEINNVEQQSLVAQHAYIFNTNWQGYQYDNDIYNGLYFALKKNEHPLTKSLEGHKSGAARALVTKVNGNHIFSGGSDGKIIRWSEADHWVAETLVEERNDYQVYSLDVSPDGNLLVAGGLYPIDRANNFIEVYDLRTKGAPKKVGGFNSDIENITFTPDGKGIYARDNRGHSIKYSDLNTTKEVINSSVKINSIDLSPDGKKLIGGGENGSLFIWDLQNNFAVTEMKNLGDHITAVAYSPDGKKIVTGDDKGVVKLIDGNAVKNLSGHTSAIEQIRYNHAGTFMATASKDKTVRLWNVNDVTKQPTVLSDHQDWVWNVVFTPDDEQLIASVHSAIETLKGTEHTIHAWPTKIPTMSGILCGFIKRNLNKEEWDEFGGADLKYESSCPNYPANYK